MGGRLAAQIVKELLSYLRDPRSRVILIGPPLTQLFIFSFAATLEVRNVDIAVYDEDHGRISYELVARLGAAGFVDELRPVHDATTMQQLLDRKEVMLGLRLPPDLSRQVLAGGTGEVQLLVDGRRANAGQIAANYVQRIVSGLGLELAGPAAVQRPRTEVRNWFNPNLDYQWFVVPGLAGILAMFSSLTVTALSIARERELGTFDQLLVSPVAPLEIVIGKMVPGLVVGTVLGSFMIAAGALLFRIPFTGSLLLLMASLVLFILSVVGFGLMISSICQTQQQAILGSFSFGVPVILISGFATPVENMPGWLQIVAEASPFKHFLIIVQGSFLKALPPADVFANAWPMAAIALVTLTLAVLFVKSRLQ